MKELIAKVSGGYIKIFPELLDRFYICGDQTIVDLIAENVHKKVKENIVNMSSLKENVKSFLNEKIENNVG